jgi:two-component system CheB/CheR fusion protein
MLMRRILSGMQTIEFEHYQNYRNYLEQHPDELTHLLNAVSINFTHFFRDHPVWDYLANHLIPQIISIKRSDEPIRVWSAGCASGEETCSLAMLLAEALGLEQFHFVATTSCNPRPFRELVCWFAAIPSCTSRRGLKSGHWFVTSA